MGITVTTSPSANAMASFGIDIVHQLSVEITAFNLPGVVNVNYELVQNVTLAANPTLEGINVNACLAVENGVTMNIFSTGDLFDALRAKDFLFYEDEVEQLPSFCTESGLSPTPPAALQERATLIERDTVECPAPAATAIPAIVFQKPA
ncbi:hypothetical protein SCHPADRAFT_160852 [Schizopora paradoxa]|uniref:Uncharacterized protein n=1 Tax=Schizopora paradoxa TaxID=27342 RepID=A0A0H2S138_9AGAM|nr:hypothetical protein SCHPADRAFT_160852 [Schizopora paradoxa]